MERITAAITGVGGYVPPDVLTNYQLENMLDITDTWIREHLGVRERRILKGPGQGTSLICNYTAMEICHKRGISPEEIEILIIATSTPDMITPNTASIVARDIGAVNAWGIDLNGACAGFLIGLQVGASFIENGRYKKVMVIGADKMSCLVDYKERVTAAVFGDGGGGVLLEPDTTGLGINDTLLKTDGNGGEHLFIKAGGSAWPATEETVQNREHFMRMNGKAIFSAAVQHLSEIIAEILQRNRLTAEDIRWLVPHQANKRIVSATAAELDFPLEKTMFNIERYGNTTAGTIPLCLWDYEDTLQKGDNLLLVAFGAGFTWGAMHVVWAYDSAD
ncbi:beta-ketoacyl-ACP synthase III [Chitinophaga nivalis]|uniref:Ketoacyl-ACP synthase III n=1 Tax=Chitinophaga nivalis TaxID=2991709 RepID=A0ABT3IJU3_9BACT|nr:beta-ketoacyl-ACP synthase III [Chitinophaga nivalis]MCW3466234.1 ketoacyl-ACP synthase III [Chitinophaga nivalis]MCW3484075.1 ketoacyl-ACP synthase III [Chitinophaga nivalis]